MKNRDGFTVLELVVYMALFVLVIGGLLLTTYSIIEGNGRLQSKVLVNEEGVFLLKKIDWALNGASGAVVSNGGKTLSIANTDPVNPVFTLTGQEIKLAHGAGSPTPVTLNSESVQVDVANSLFEYDLSSRVVKITLAFKNLSQSRIFKANRYLRL